MLRQWQLRLTYTRRRSDIRCTTRIKQAATLCPTSFAHRCPCLKIFLNCSAIKRLSVRAGKRTTFSVLLPQSAEKTAMNALSQRATGTRSSLPTAALRCFLQERSRPTFTTKKQLWRNTALRPNSLFRLRRFRATRLIIFPEFRE